MDKISEEMKTEKDFIEKMEASSVNKEAIPKKSEAAIEREKLQMEMMIKSKEESKDVSNEEKQDAPSVSIYDLQASPIVSKEIHNHKKDDKNTTDEPEIKNIELKIKPEPEYKYITLEVSAKRPPIDDAPWADEQTTVEEKTNVVENKTDVVEKENKKKEIKEPKHRVASKPKVEKEVSVVSAAEAAVIEEKEEEKSQLGKDIIVDDMDQRVRDENIEIRKANEARLGEIDSDELTPEKVIDTFNNNYEDSEEVDNSDDKEVEIVDDSSENAKEKVEAAIEKAAEIFLSWQNVLIFDKKDIVLQ